MTLKGRKATAEHPAPSHHAAADEPAIGKRLFAGSVAIAALLSGGAAMAADSGVGWYPGINLGRSSAKINAGDVDKANQGVTTSTSIETHDTAYSLNFGYLFSHYVAIEGGYVDFGKLNYQSAVAARLSTALMGNFLSDRGRALVLSSRGCADQFFDIP